MEKSRSSLAGISSNSPEIIKRTKEYQQRVENIKVEIRLKYDELLKGEKYFVQRLALRIKMQLEMRKIINGLTSPDKLYLALK